MNISGGSSRRKERKQLGRYILSKLNDGEPRTNIQNILDNQAAAGHEHELALCCRHGAVALYVTCRRGGDGEQAAAAAFA